MNYDNDMAFYIIKVGYLITFSIHRLTLYGFYNMCDILYYFVIIPCKIVTNKIYYLENFVVDKFENDSTIIYDLGSFIYQKCNNFLIRLYCT